MSTALCNFPAKFGALGVLLCFGLVLAYGFLLVTGSIGPERAQCGGARFSGRFWPPGRLLDRR
jgi:hypothetical protein